MISLWHRMFAAEPYEDVSSAVDRLVMTREFAWTPSVGEVTAELTKGRKALLMGEDEAWRLVRRAVCNSANSSGEQFAKLPPPVQRAVGGSWKLKEWSQYSDEQMEKLAGPFKKAYSKELDNDVKTPAVAFKTYESEAAKKLAEKFRFEQ